MSARQSRADKIAAMKASRAARENAKSSSGIYSNIIKFTCELN